MTISRADSDQRVETAFELRPDKRPPELDVFDEDDKLTSMFIYELSGDTLRICTLGRLGKTRPKAIGSTADDERRLLVLKRVKGNDKK